jgi:hypothetical protein
MWRAEMLRHTHEYCQNQITLADAKAAGILAWDAALVALMSVAPRPEGLDLLYVLLLLAAGSLVISVVFCASTLWPRMPSAGTANTVSFVDAACSSAASYSESVLGSTQEEFCDNLCKHIHLLGSIAREKFERIRVAVALSTTASGLLILSLLA